jgi:pimeloyl-ACP methyl ester carboxylesterase
MLQQLQVPAMLLYGDQDPLAMEEGYRDEISVNPRTPVLSWPGVRHMGMHEPEEFAGVVMEFFASPSQPVHRVWQNVRPSSIPAGVRSWC